MPYFGQKLIFKQFNNKNYVLSSIFFLPLIKKELSLDNFDYIVDSDCIYIHTELLSKHDIKLISLTWKCNQDIMDKYFEFTELKRANYFSKHYNCIINLHTFLSYKFKINYIKTPNTEFILNEHYTLFLTYFYVNNSAKEILSTNNLETFIQEFYSVYFINCLKTIELDTKLNIHFFLLLNLSFIKQDYFFKNIKTQAELKKLLEIMMIFFMVLVYNKDYKKNIDISIELNTYILNAFNYESDYRLLESVSYLDECLAYFANMFDLKESMSNILKNIYIYIYNNPLNDTLFKELVNSINYTNTIFAYLETCYFNILLKTLWLFNNTEFTVRASEDFSTRMHKEIVYVTNTSSLKNTKNYNNSYRINKNLLILLSDYLGLDVKLIRLLWNYSFKLENTIYTGSNLIKRNQFSDKLPNIPTNIISEYFSTIQVKYNDVMVPDLELKKIDFIVFQSPDDNSYDFDNLNSIMSFDVYEGFNKIKLKELKSDWLLLQLYRDIHGLMCTIIKNLPFFISITGKEFKTVEKTYYDNVIYQIIFKLDHLLIKIFGTLDYNSRIMCILEIKKNIETILTLFNIKDLNTIQFQDIYNTYSNEAKIKLAIIELAKDLKTIKLSFNVIKLDLKAETMNSIIFSHLNKFKKYCIYLSKNLSKYYSYYSLLETTQSILKLNQPLTYYIFLDFRGRVYVRNTHQSWIANLMLRYGIQLNFLHRYSFIEIEEHLIEFNKQNFLYLLNFFNIKNNELFIPKDDEFSDIKKLTYHIIYIYMSALGCSEDNSKGEETWFFLGLNYYKRITNKDEDLFNNIKLEEYNKVINYITIIDNVIKLYNSNNLEELIKLSKTYTIVIDSVTNGYTHIVGGFKDINKNLLGEQLHTINYYKNENKSDLYTTIGNWIKEKFKNIETLKTNFLKTYPLAEKNDWDLVIDLYSKYIDIIVSRAHIKSAIMTVFYGSSFSKWQNSILEQLKSNSVLLEKLNSEITWKDLKGDKLPNISLNYFSWITAKLLKQQFKELNLLDYSKEFVTQLEKQIKNIGIDNIDGIVLKIFDIEVHLMYKIGLQKKQINVESLSKTQDNYIYIYIRYLTSIDLNKTATAFTANLCHTLDAYICREFILQCKAKQIPVVTIHDCFIIPVIFYKKAKQMYNKIYYEVYEKYNFKDVIFIKTKDNKYIPLFEEGSSVLLKENWKYYKNDILNAKYNLMFE